MAYQFLSVLEEKEVRVLPELNLIVKKTPAREGYERLPYLVSVRWDETMYQFDPETNRFFVDINNQEKMWEQLQEHKAEKDKMKEDGKTDEEIEEYFAGKGTVFFDRKEIVFYPSIAEKVQECITLL